MSHRHLAVIIVLSFSVSSCAYFNTFYNTKKYFNEAQKEREKRQGDVPSSTELAKYNQTIEKASKILEIYPDSKYVDDAVMILGECFYYKEDFVRAERKFEEIITYFPKSEYVGPARLWLAKTKMKSKDYPGARFILLELINSANVKRDLREESQFLLGEIQFEQEYYLEAEQEYQKAIEAKNHPIKTNAYLKLGESQIKIQDYGQAVQSFKQALKYTSDKKIAFEAELRYGRALKLAGDPRAAAKVLMNLLSNTAFKDQHGWVKLEIADCLYQEGRSLRDKLKGANLQYLGKIEEAMDEYKKITLEYKRTEVAARANFEIARIYEEDLGDFTNAKEYYEKVKVEYPKSDQVTIANQKAKDLTDLIRLKSLVKKSQGMQLSRDASGGYALTELELLLLEHGVHPELRFMHKQKKLAKLAQASQTTAPLDGTDAAQSNDTPSEDLDALVTNKLQLAETYLFQFGQVDSAMNEYTEVITLFPEHPGAAKALFSCALINDTKYLNKFKTDSLLYVLIERFPESYQAQEARKILGLPLKVNQNEFAAEAFQHAEETLFVRKDAGKAAEEFQKIIEYFPNSEYAPKSMYALGWIHEQLSENQRAIEIYRQILEKYPQSDYSKAVKKKLAEVEKSAKKAEAPLPAVAPAAQDILEEEKQLPPQPINADTLEVDDLKPVRSESKVPEEEKKPETKKPTP
jgi:TolA-binding protein